MPDVKFCGMTRAEDVREAVGLGARYVGVIMTDSPRRLTPGRAAELVSEVAGTGVASVGVFGNESVDAIVSAVRVSGVDVIQLHGTAHSREDRARISGEAARPVWCVIRVGRGGVGEADRGSLDGSAGILFDTMGAGAQLGGIGVAFDWAAAAADAARLRPGRLLIVAGGLRPDNVALAIERLAPDVVDVSSGVESAPGTKDHQLMAAFMRSVRSTIPAPGR